MQDLQKRATEAASMAGIAQHGRDFEVLNRANDQLLDVIEELFDVIFGKVRCDTCSGTGREACGCDGTNKQCFCNGTQKLKCTICSGTGKV